VLRNGTDILELAKQGVTSPRIRRIVETHLQLDTSMKKHELTFKKRVGFGD